MTTLDSRLRTLETAMPRVTCPECARWPIIAVNIPGQEQPPATCPVCGQVRQSFTITIDRMQGGTAHDAR